MLTESLSDLCVAVAGSQTPTKAVPAYMRACPNLSVQPPIAPVERSSRRYAASALLNPPATAKPRHFKVRYNPFTDSKQWHARRLHPARHSLLTR
jgi:hypothetical protein